MMKQQKYISWLWGFIISTLIFSFFFLNRRGNQTDIMVWNYHRIFFILWRISEIFKKWGWVVFYLGNKKWPKVCNAANLDTDLCSFTIEILTRHKFNKAIDLDESQFSPKNKNQPWNQISQAHSRYLNLEQI